MDNALAGIFKEYPFLTVVGPIIGLILLEFQRAEKLKGFASLAAASGITLAVLGAFGLAQHWHAADWAKVPFAALVIVATSNLSGATMQQVREAIGSDAAAVPEPPAVVSEDPVPEPAKPEDDSPVAP